MPDCFEFGLLPDDDDESDPLEAPDEEFFEDAFGEDASDDEDDNSID